MKPNLLFWVAIVFLCFACKKTETPSFLHIEDIDLYVGSNSEAGTDDHGISDAWVYLNDQLVGIYELPATIPVVTEGLQKVSVLAGIKNNGIQSARVIYPFYDSYNGNLTFIPGDTIDFAGDSENTTIINGHTCPVVEYFDEGLIFWNERFDEAGINFESTDNSLTDMTITQDPDLVFNYDPSSGSHGSGLVILNQDASYFEVTSTHEFSPIKGQKVYLELHYFTECAISIGVYENAPTHTKVYGKGLYPVENWNKAYIELTQEVAQRANATSYSIFIEGELETGQGECQILLDNIKLIYPE